MSAAADSAIVRPIFHLSFPVTDLDDALGFYVGGMGGEPGRRAPGWADVALFGAQLTLQHRPGEVLNPMPRSRHFGATLEWSAWQEFTARPLTFVEPPRVDHAGTLAEQAKAMVADPSGNLIEIKAYRHPAAVLGALAGM